MILCTVTCTGPISANPGSKQGSSTADPRSIAREWTLYRTARLIVALSLKEGFTPAQSALQDLRQYAVRLANHCLQDTRARTQSIEARIEGELQHLIGAIESCEESGALHEPVLASLWHLTAHLHAQLATKLQPGCDQTNEVRE